MDEDDEDEGWWPDDLDYPAVKYIPVHHQLEVAGQDQLSDLMS